MLCSLCVCLCGVRKRLDYNIDFVGVSDLIILVNWYMIKVCLCGSSHGAGSAGL